MFNCCLAAFGSISFVKLPLAYCSLCISLPFVFNEPKPGSRLFVSDTLVTVLFEIPAFKAPVNSFVYICFGTEVKNALQFLLVV